MILNEMKGHIKNAIGYLRERPFGQDKIDGATEEIKKAIEFMNNEKSTYIIELGKFNISNDNTNARETTEGINRALEYAKENGYKIVKLPKGHYAIDISVVSPIDLSDGENGWTHNRAGISMQSDIELIMTDAILEMIPTDNPYYSIFTISGCNNSKITGGTIIGDRNTHNYGQRINNNGDELELGGIDDSTGLEVLNDTMVRTKDYISTYYGDVLPKEFIVMVLENTSKNTTDGGVRYVYCYGDNDEYLGMAEAEDYNSFWEKATLIEGTKKIKISFKDETRLDAKYYITTNFIYPSHEFGSGITIADSNNIEINNVVIKSIIGDCIQTFAPPLKVTVDNLKIIDCTLEDARRQGISFVATGENYEIKGCNIGKIYGVDPQSGIDIENYEYVKNVLIDSCRFYDSKKLDIINYNGSNIEIKNSNFTGGIGVTYGYNMNIHDNSFIYSDPSWLDKTHKGWALSPNRVENTYFYITDNYFEGYNIGGMGVQSCGVEDSLFTRNEIVNSVCRIYGNSYENIYRNSTVRYVFPNEFKKETLIESILCGENNGDGTTDRLYNEFTIINSQFEGGNNSYKNSILNKCNIYADKTTFCNKWSGSYIIKDSRIETTYDELIPFINEQGCPEVTILNCEMNLSCTPFVYANYGIFNLQNCNIVFNESYKGEDNISIFNTGNFNGNKFYKNFDNPKIVLPPSSTVNDVYYEEGVTV